jgi:hypothetical protein
MLRRKGKEEEEGAELRRLGRRLGLVPRPPPLCVNKHARSNTVRTCSVPLCLYPFLVLDYDYDYGYD